PFPFLAPEPPRRVPTDLGGFPGPGDRCAPLGTKHAIRRGMILFFRSFRPGSRMPLEGVPHMRWAIITAVTLTAGLLFSPSASAAAPGPAEATQAAACDKPCKRAIKDRLPLQEPPRRARSLEFLDGPVHVLRRLADQ